MSEIETRLQGRIASDECDCNTPDDCMCEQDAWEYFEEINNPFFESSDVFYYEKNGVAEITDFSHLKRTSVQQAYLNRFVGGTWGKAYSFLQETLHRCNQYVLYWERKNGALYITLGATHIEVRPTEQTQCAMCGDVIDSADQDIMKRLNFLHPSIYKLPTYHNDIPFCHECKDVYQGQYVVIVSAYHRYIKTHTRVAMKLTFAINCTPEEVEADYYIKASDVFTKSGYAPSPDYHVFSIGKIQVFSTNEWEAVKIEHFTSLELL